MNKQILHSHFQLQNPRWQYLALLLLTSLGISWKGITLSLAIFITCTTLVFSQSGLHYTPEEIAIWQQRANATATQNTSNYRIAGDVQTNSPGDWTRIKDRARLFLDSAEYERYTGPVPDTTRTYIDAGDRPSPEYSTQISRQNSLGATVTMSSAGSKGTLIRDAAFYFLITGDTQYRDAVRIELLAQAAEPNMDLSNTSRWKPNELKDAAPGFLIAEWFAKYYFAYDYIKHTLSNSDKATLDQWFLNAANFFKNEVDVPINGLFSNRSTNDNNDNYIIPPTSRLQDDGGGPRSTHFGGYATYSFHRFFNNRRASQARFYAMVGLGQNNATLKNSAKKFVKDWLAFGVFPDGTCSDFERWGDGVGDLPDGGWSYGMYVVSTCADIAEHFARQGDFELFNHVENTGVAGQSGNSNTSGGNKTIKKTVQHMLQYQVGASPRLTRYGTDEVSKNGQLAYLIDGINTASSWHATFDTWFARVNQYYKNDTILDAYLRTRENALEYPSSQTTPKLANQAGNQPWMGVWSAYPGILFMSGQMESLVNPYLQVKISSPVQNASFTSGSNISITASADNNNRGISKVEFYNGTTKLGEHVTSPYSYTWNNVAVGTYTIIAKAIDNSNVVKSSEAISITVAAPPIDNCSPTGSISLETWNSVGGKTVNFIPVTTTPTLSSTINSFETDYNYDYYGSRIRGYIHAPVSGNYTFWVSGDNNAELWLSTNENPANKQRIAYLVDNETVANTTNLYSSYREWTKYSSQQSVSIALVAGQKYYIEALYKEDAGGDHVSVGWQLPDATQERPIPGCRLSPFNGGSSSKISFAEELTETVYIYPNPFSDKFTVSVGKAHSGAVSIKIVDVVGKVYYQATKTLSETESTISLSGKDLKPGIYFLKINNGLFNSKVVKIIKQ